MKLIIVNLYEGLRDNKTKRVVPLNRQVCVDESAFWCRRVEQGHVRLVRRMTPEEFAQEKREQSAQDPAAKPCVRRRGKASKKAAKKSVATPTAPKSEKSEG